MHRLPWAAQRNSSLQVVRARGAQEVRKTAEIIDISSNRCLSSPAGQVEGRQRGLAPKPRFILVASEDEYLWSSLRALLESSRFTACRFTRPEDACRIVRDRKVDLLVADSVALTSCEFRLASEVGAFAPDLPVLMIRAADMNDRAARLAEQRGWSSISIPFRLPELLDALEKVFASQPSPSSQGRQSPAGAQRWRSLLPWFA